MTKTTKTPATKTSATKTSATKTPATSVKAEPVMIPDTKTLMTTHIVLCSKESKSLVGKFIIKFFNDHKDESITGSRLAGAFISEFKTKTGIQPDVKWAFRNVKLFLSKRLISVNVREGLKL